MKKWVLACSLLLLGSFVEAQVWQETFNSYAAGTTSHATTPAWTTVQPAGNPGGTKKFSTQTPATGYQIFEVNDTGVGIEGVWTSEIVDISSFTEVALQVTLYSYFTFSTDYIRCYYKRNGGAETLFGELDGNSGLNIASAASAIVTGGAGATVQIVIRGSENTLGQNSGVDRTLAFDDVTITNITVLYSIANASWSAGTTWSTAGFAGAACSCTPTQDSRVIIGNNKTVTIGSASATVAGITVQNTGKLTWSASQDLTMARGGTINVNSGGQITNSTFTANLIYGAYTFSLIVDGSMAMTNVQFNTGSQVTLSGAGTLSATGFLITDGNGKSVTNGITGSVTLSGDLNFAVTSADNSSFINTGNLTAARIFFGGKSVAITNSGTLTSTTTGIYVNSNTSDGNSITNSGTLNISGINLNSGNFTLNNSGTINQSTSFSNVDTGSAFNNLNNGVWNFSGTAFTNVKLFASTGDNTFNYALAGAQTIITPQDSYSNLKVSGSGAKTTAANLTMTGDVSIQNAQLVVSTNNNDLTVAGDWTVSGTGSFTKGTRTVTMNGTTDQTITNSSGESFYNLIVNKTAGNLILSSATPSNLTVSNVLTLTNGGLDINGNALNITSSAVAAVTRTNGFIKSETTATPYARMIWSVGTTLGSYVFPFGKTSATSDYIPFTFQTTAVGTGAGTVSLSTYPTASNNIPYPSGVTNVNTSTADNSANVVDRFWIITLASYITNPTASMTFTATSSESTGITTLTAQRWNTATTKWDAPISGQTNPTASSAKVTGVTAFSPWTLVGNNTVLPIQLMDFTATLNIDKVQLSWKTAEEINNDYFTIEKSRDGESFATLKVIQGKGTSFVASNYALVDEAPFAGKNYYRLKQTDFNGNSSIFAIREVTYDGIAMFSAEAYPNPVAGNELFIKFQGAESGDIIPVRLFNLLGSMVYLNKLTASDAGDSDPKLIFAEPLPAGVYLLQIGSLPPQKILVR